MPSVYIVYKYLENVNRKSENKGKGSGTWIAITFFFIFFDRLDSYNNIGHGLHTFGSFPY